MEPNKNNHESQEYLIVSRARFLERIGTLANQANLAALKAEAASLNSALKGRDAELVDPVDGEGMPLKIGPLLEEIRQILDAYTFERARYYAERLRKGFTEVKTSGINDINLRRWKDYDEILTDSLWVIDRRDTSGAHLGWYWGNYIPQIPHQLILRYTRKGELVVDPFVGSGTTLIECRRLGRHGLGVEINPDMVEKARELVASEENPYGIVTRLDAGDSRSYDFRAAVREMGFDAVDLYLMHPPYHDIIRFGDDPHDLSNAATTEEFLGMFGAVLDNTLPLLRRGRYVGIVIGDKYRRGEWIPLGFYCMQEVMKRGLSLKSIVVKNFDQTKGKRQQQELWRYRALAGGFYVFKHEYIFIFRKV
ncbi:MAG: DNA methyltransferase [Thermoanaerobacterales bacterium]|nr:DNA methyltransferase [Thermoanaerobacterales bacterium]